MTKVQFLEMTKREQWDNTYVSKMVTIVEEAKKVGFPFSYDNVLPPRNEVDTMTKKEFLAKTKNEFWDKKYVSNIMEIVSEAENEGGAISYDIIIPPPRLIAYH